MKIKEIWTNYKIYAFILGIVTGTIIYNSLGIDFSFDMIENIKVNDIKKSYIYLITSNFRFWIIVFGISFLKIKNKIAFLLIYIQSFVLSGTISLALLSGSYIFMYGCITTITKIFIVVLLCDDKRPVVSKIFSFLLLLLGTALENILYL